MRSPSGCCCSAASLNFARQLLVESTLAVDLVLVVAVGALVFVTVTALHRAQLQPR